MFASGTVSVPSTGQRRPGLPRASPAVLSARWGLASGFGTGPGVPPMLWPLTGGRRPPYLGDRESYRVPWGPHGEEEKVTRGHLLVPGIAHVARPAAAEVRPEELGRLVRLG